MVLTLREKKRNWVRYIFRIAILTVDIAGLYACLYLEVILTALSGNQKIETLLIDILRKNPFLLEELNTAIKAAQCIVLVLLAGLCSMICHLILHEVQARVRIRKLLYCIGYKNMQVYAYEFLYEFWDLFFGTVLSAVGFAVFSEWIIRIEGAGRVLKAIHWNAGKNLFVFFMTMLVLLVLNILCCVSAWDIGKDTKNDTEKNQKQ